MAFGGHTPKCAKGKKPVIRQRKQGFKRRLGQARELETGHG